MILKTKIDVKLNTLRRELNKLEATSDEKPISRRNARRRVLSAMRALRAQVDDSFPAIVKPREGIVRADPKKRIKRFLATGYRRCTPIQAGQFAACGVRVKSVSWTETSQSADEKVFVPRRGWVVKKGRVFKQRHEELFIPLWAAAIGLDRARLREAKKSVKARSAAIVAEALATT